jgi:hypothetical protein
LRLSGIYSTLKYDSDAQKQGSPSLVIQVVSETEQPLDDIRLKIHIVQGFSSQDNLNTLPNQSMDEDSPSAQKSAYPLDISSRLCLTETSFGGSPVTLLPGMVYMTEHVIPLPESSTGNYQLWLGIEKGNGPTIPIDETDLDVQTNFARAEDFSISKNLQISQ